MLSFRSILLAAAALAAVASAIPTPETSSTGVTTGGLTSGQIVPVGVPLKRDESPGEGKGGNGKGRGKGKGRKGGKGKGKGGEANKPEGFNEKHDLAHKRGHSSCGDIIKNCHDDIAVIVVKIDAAIKVKGGAKYVDHGLVISLLGEIVALLQGLLHDLKLIVKVELLLGGVACTLQELAGVVADLLILVIEVVWLVLSVVGFLDVTLCGVIATIGGLLYEILGVVFGLVEGLLVLVVGLIEPYGAHCEYIRYTDILVLLGIEI